MIGKKEVEHIAKLARLGLSEGETEKFQKELSSILDYIDKLKEVDISGVEATSHPTFLEHVTREDEPKKEKDGRNLIASAPDGKDNFVKVKSIFK
jgi:aspartyl/glutamyl-tRNA(Asn/Gln) amidotransferase C subunit